MVVQQGRKWRCADGGDEERYPEAGLEIALEIGANVAKGEVKWG